MVVSSSMMANFSKTQLLEDPLRPVLETPTHRTVGPGRSILHHPGQRRALGTVKLPLPARRPPVDQPIGTISVEAQHPIADHLKPDPADPRREPLS